MVMTLQSPKIGLLRLPNFFLYVEMAFILGRENIFLLFIVSPDRACISA